MSNISRKIGQIGEKQAKIFLQKRGFIIKKTNYWLPWGELDLVAFKDNVWYFCEVKTFISTKENVSREPEDLISERKIKSLKRTIDYYLENEVIDLNCDWTVVAILITLSKDFKLIDLQWLEDII